MGAVPTKRIVILSARVGAGHDGAAAELTRRMRDKGFEVTRHNFLDLLPGRLASGCATPTTGNWNWRRAAGTGR